MTDGTTSRASQPRPSSASTRPSVMPPSDWAGVKQLFAAVRSALRVLGSATGRHPGPGVEGEAPERVAQYLRAVVTVVPAGSGPYGEAVAAVTAACADLDDGDLPGAYLALHAAASALHEAATA